MEPLGADDPREVGGYQLLGVLGMGGMGRVYLGRSPDNTPVAVKIIHPQQAANPDFRKRFRREVRAAQSVSGTFTAEVIKAGVADNPPWLATAFVGGPSLQDAVNAGPLPLSAVWRLAGSLVQALHAVHARDLVHRDLKPANVLLASEGPKLIDFGISKAAADGTTITRTGLAIGTPAYMSPEQARGEKVGPESDVFSLGSVIAFAASGRSPFGDGLPWPILNRVLNARPDLSGIVSRDLRRFLADCLALEPAKRPTLPQLGAAALAGMGSYPVVASGSYWPDPLAAMVSIREDWFRRHLASWFRPGPDAGVPPAMPQPPPPDRPPGPPDGLGRLAGPVFTPAPARRAPLPAPPRLPDRPGGRSRSGRHPAATESAMRGDRMRALRRYEDAEDAYRESIRLDPDDPVKYNDLGGTLCLLDRLMEAEEAFRRAIKLAPDYTEARHNLCHALYRMGRFTDADEACRVARSAGPCCRRRGVAAGP